MYAELNQVLVSVEQCASLFLLEDFLRNRIKNIDDVKNLKTPQSYYGSMKTATTAANNTQSKQARLIMDKALERMREMMESTASRERMRTESEEFSTLLVEEIVSSKNLSEIDQIDIIRQLEV